MVGEGIDERDGLRPMHLRLCDRPGEGVRLREHGDGGRNQRPVAQRPGGTERTRGPVAHRLELHPVEAIDRELDHERDGVPRDTVGQVPQSGRQTHVRLVVTTHEMLDPGARRREPDPQGRRLLGHELEALEEGAVRLDEVPVCGKCPGQRQEQLDPFLGGGTFGKEPERGREPAGSAGRGALRARRARLAQRRDRVGVAVPCGQLEVVGARRRRRTPSRERRRRALVRAQPPAAGRPFVDGAAHERVPEAEAARYVGRAHQVAAGAARRAHPSPPRRGRRRRPRRARGRRARRRRRRRRARRARRPRAAPAPR